jgi:uncharacterized protein (DUF433 family)
MTLSIATEPIPLETDEQGTVRVRGTRVTLDSIVHAFVGGASAEEIAAERFPAVSLDDAYAVVLYYLRHRDAVDAYLREREECGDRIRRSIEAQFDKTGLRDRLVARRARRSAP